MVELAEASSQSVEPGCHSSIDFVWHQRTDVQEDLIRRLLENFAAGIHKGIVTS